MSNSWDDEQKKQVNSAPDPKQEQKRSEAERPRKGDLKEYKDFCFEYVIGDRKISDGFAKCSTITDGNGDDDD